MSARRTATFGNSCHRSRNGYQIQTGEVYPNSQLSLHVRFPCFPPTPPSSQRQPRSAPKSVPSKPSRAIRHRRIVVLDGAGALTVCSSKSPAQLPASSTTAMGPASSRYRPTNPSSWPVYPPALGASPLVATKSCINFSLPKKAKPSTAHSNAPSSISRSVSRNSSIGSTPRTRSSPPPSPNHSPVPHLAFPRLTTRPHPS